MCYECGSLIFIQSSNHSFWSDWYGFHCNNSKVWCQNNKKLDKNSAASQKYGQSKWNKIWILLHNALTTEIAFGDSLAVGKYRPANKIWNLTIFKDYNERS